MNTREQIIDLIREERVRQIELSRAYIKGLTTEKGSSLCR